MPFRLLLLLAALAVGAGIAILDRGQDEVQPAVFLLLVAGFALSCARPRDAWAYALLLGAGVPGLDLIMRLAGNPPPVDSVAGSTVIAFLPAGIGALVGAGVGRLIRGPERAPPGV